VRRFEREFLSFLDAEHADILKDIKEKKDLTEEIENRLKQAIESFKKGFSVSEGE
jgi:F-type H+/Na+-transporting ATPase subunit alpha